MQARRTIVSVAIVGVFAAAASALAYGPGPRAGDGFGPGAHMDPAWHSERAQWRLDELKAALKLQPAQRAAWDAYAAKVKSEAQARAQLRQGVWEARGDAQAFADSRMTMMRHNAQAAGEINELRKSLYASLSDEQRATFDQYAMGPRFARGPAGARPGYGRGGCLGMI